MAAKRSSTSSSKKRRGGGIAAHPTREKNADEAARLREIDADPDMDEEGELDVEQYPLPEGLVGDMTDEEWDAIPVDDDMLQRMRKAAGLSPEGPGGGHEQRQAKGNVRPQLPSVDSGQNDISRPPAKEDRSKMIRLIFDTRTMTPEQIAKAMNAVRDAALAKRKKSDSEGNK
jgi:hypothetical protein